MMDWKFKELRHRLKYAWGLFTGKYDYLELIGSFKLGDERVINGRVQILVSKEWGPNSGAKYTWRDKDEMGYTNPFMEK